MQAYIHKISGKFKNQIDSIIMCQSYCPLLYYYYKQPCEHNNLGIYQPILMKLCLPAYIHKISDESENQIDSIMFAGVIDLCCKIIMSNSIVCIACWNTANCTGPRTLHQWQYNLSLTRSTMYCQIFTIVFNIDCQVTV